MKSIMQAGLVNDDVEAQFKSFPGELQDLEQWKAFDALLKAHEDDAVRVMALVLISQRQEIRILKKRLVALEHKSGMVTNTAGGRLPPPESQ